MTGRHPVQAPTCGHPMEAVGYAINNKILEAIDLALRCIAIVPEGHRAPGERSEGSSFRRSNAAHIT